MRKTLWVLDKLRTTSGEPLGPPLVGELRTTAGELIVPQWVNSTILDVKAPGGIKLFSFVVALSFLIKLYLKR